ncbi:MAG: tRNA (cytidine(34)-2'-O)-methyltransferase [Desulfovibrionaceae bacterium]|nr:tRNA (cytidine(34)-2'-O)-methyltransferase [Desulfovibrionaceae bacterium]
MHIVLYHPEIPPNTGNIARLCAATNTRLHLIEPLGFSLDDRYLKRAGLDYWPNVTLALWPDLDAYRSDQGAGRRLIMTSARQGTPVHKFRFRADDALLFGSESTGLPPELWNLAAGSVRIPTLDTVRSLNLSTAAGIILYQGLIRTGGLADWL